MEARSVLFVCLGNICRSPMAEGALRAAAARAGVTVTIDSAGTGDWHRGDPPDRRAQATAARHGVDISDLRARQITPGDFHRFTHIVVMDERNLTDIRQIDPGDGRARVSLLLDHVPGQAGRFVADPYTGNADGFEETWRQVSAGAEGLLALLTAPD